MAKNCSKQAVKAWQKLQKNCKKLPKDTKSSQTMSKLAKIKKNSKEKTNDGKICQKLLEGGKNCQQLWKVPKRCKKKMVKVDKKWQKILKVPERMTKNLSLHDIWHFVIFGILLQVDKLTSLTLWRVDMLTSYQEFRIIWFWAPKFETTTYSLTYLLTRVKSRDASASKNACAEGGF